VEVQSELLLSVNGLMLFLNSWRVSSHIVRNDTSPPAIQKQHWHSREALIELPLIECEWAFRIRAIVLRLKSEMLFSILCSEVVLSKQADALLKNIVKNYRCVTVVLFLKCFKIIRQWAHINKPFKTLAVRALSSKTHGCRLVFYIWQSARVLNYST
jgi:hypothetical protein